MLLKKRIREAILGSLQFFIVTHDVFCTVGAEMLSGGSVVRTVGEGWDQLERVGPKDDRQVTEWISPLFPSFPFFSSLSSLLSFFSLFLSSVFPSSF